MKRGSFVGRRTRLNRVSQKVRGERTEFARVYREIDARSQGRCEVQTRDGLEWRGVYATTPRLGLWRCLARALDHHHCVKPRRSHTTPALVIHLCRRHHDMTTASYRTGRLAITPHGDGSFTCAVVQKESKWA